MFCLFQVSCKPGYEDEKGACTKCKIGYYKKVTGAIKCTLCPVNFITLTEGSTGVTQCSVGKCLLASPFLNQG